jgi:hypothetical protein
LTPDLTPIPRGNLGLIKGLALPNFPALVLFLVCGSEITEGFRVDGGVWK